MAEILYHAMPGDWRKEQKYQFLEKSASVAGVRWTKLTPDKKGNWITNDTDEEFDAFLPIGSKEAKAKDGTDVAIFKLYSLGVATNRDEWVYGFSPKEITAKVQRMIANYNSEVFRYKAAKCPKDLDGFVNNDKHFVKWTDRLKESMRDEQELKFVKGHVRDSLYRPFTKQSLYFDHLLNQRRYQQHRIFPTTASENENVCICAPGDGNRKEFGCLVIKRIVALDFAFEKAQCFPLFAYSEDGKERRDNITPKALTLFQIFYDDEGITRADIFHYVYALLHHPAYRTRYAENLKRELPRIPFIGVAADVSRLKSPVGKPGKKSEPTDVGCYGASFYPLSAVEKMQGDKKPDHNPKASAKLFHAFAAAGKKLADLHVNYESAQEFPLKRQENEKVKLDWRVEAMKLSKDKASLFYNDFLTLSGIPAEVYDYRLGNRSALEWVIDQYRITKDDNGNIASDPNRLDDDQYIVRLIGQVSTVSLETMKVVRALPEFQFE